MSVHLEGDPVITWEEQCSVESRITGHTLQLARALGLGDRWDSGGKHWDRVKNALRTKFCLAPPLSGYYKDHKTPTEGREYLGPKIRPVCGAAESSNGPLSHILLEILSFLGDTMDREIGALCLSTEEMCCALEMYNRRSSTTRNPVVFSMDVTAMFPSLKHKEVARTCREEFLRSSLTLEEVDTVALGLYLAIIYQDRRQELVGLGLDLVVQKRKFPKAKKILITTEEVMQPGDKTVSKFWPQQMTPSKEQEKLMMALALEEGFLAVFGSHYYSFNGEVRLQKEGAPIGLDLSGAAGKVEMLSWCRKFQLILVEASSNLHEQEVYLKNIDYRKRSEKVDTGNSIKYFDTLKNSKSQGALEKKSTSKSV